MKTKLIQLLKLMQQPHHHKRKQTEIQYSPSTFQQLLWAALIDTSQIHNQPLYRNNETISKRIKKFANVEHSVAIVYHI